MTTELNLQCLTQEAKKLHINDPKMIASWIYNKRDGKKFYTVKQLRKLILNG